MKQTFREFFLAIEPEQRAQIVLRVVMSRHQQLGFTGDHAKITFDAAEYLPDEQTIIAYLALVDGLHNPSLYRRATDDAERARKRIADEQLHAEQQNAAKAGRVRWVSQDMLGRKFYFPLLAISARSSSGGQPSAVADKPADKALGARAQRTDWSLSKG